MGNFYDSISDDLDALDASGAGGPDPVSFGADYSTDANVVKQVQTAINGAGYTPVLAYTGPGPKTTAGIKWIQAQKSVPVTGIIDDATLKALGITPPKVQALVTQASGLLAQLQQQFSPLLAWSQKFPQPLTQGKGVAPGFKATKASVVNSFVDWTTPLEGWLPFMYIDALGYVTTGMGNLIDPIGLALALPWKNADGSRASSDQVTAAWNAVDAQRSDPKGKKQASGPATKGGGSQGGVTSIRVTKDDIHALVAQKLKENETYLISGLSNFDQAPADAQLAAHSMSWAMGPGFAKTWTSFRDAFLKGDWAGAAAQSHMQGTGIDMRNMANKLLLTNADLVAKNKKDPDTLYYIPGLPGLAGGAVASILAVATGLVYWLVGGAVVIVGAMLLGHKHGQLR